MASPERKRRRRKKGVLPPPPEPPSLDVYYETVRGRERLRAMLTAGFWKDYRPFLDQMGNMMLVTFLSCGFVGGLVGYIKTKNRFKKDHRLVLYKHPLEYKRQMSSHAMIGFSLAAMKWGLDVSCALGAGLVAHSSVYLYTNEFNFLSVYVGCLSTQLYFHLHRGVKRMAVSLLFGAVWGLPVGGAFYLVNSMEHFRRRRQRDERRYQRYLKEVLAWREAGRLMGQSTVEYFDSYIVAPRPWHTEEQNAQTLRFRQLPPLTPEKEKRLQYVLQAHRHEDMKRTNFGVGRDES